MGRVGARALARSGTQRAGGGKGVCPREGRARSARGDTSDGNRGGLAGWLAGSLCASQFV